MYDNYNYPPGADTPDAPWNQREPEPIEVACDTNVTLKKQIVVTTTNYEEDCDETGCDIFLHDGYAEFEQHVKEQHLSLPKLLDELAKYINGELASGVTGSRKWELQQMLEDCQGWTEDYFEIEQIKPQGA